MQPNRSVTLFGNRLVLVAPAGKGFPVQMQREFDLPAAFDGRIVLADPAHVPLGIYAREALEFYGWWQDLQPRLLTTMDARSAMRAVSLGKVPLGVLYLSDLQADKTLDVLAVFPEDSHGAIRYNASLTRQAQPQAIEFLEYLESEEAQSIFRQFGFTMLD